MATYKKNIAITYKHEQSDEAELLLDETFDSIFEWLIGEQKQLRRYFQSKKFKMLVKRLKKQESILADYLSIH
ncbi:hypothetical protein A2975_01150 [Candidatus Woesebacteria bacterium RIFCSPLOWO2_01_FULL_44_14]|uniref:Uncharacterized protein n=1 Tax=Candidatus Woesebacteria bacterium RIFCSPLOWO2_01_FULL_44_14 TaxID=1802525 RepID=A0A1F8C5B4_9BACT|nr:MAG: hypothetical protein A2975_01150 [Candidatus Woesebacteria bacterium RIFCSPLOWO2_01_FULL_44_14]